MRYHSVTAILAAEITASFKPRQRLVQLPPIAFHLLSRNRSISSTAQQSRKSTTHRRAQSTQSDASGKISAEKDRRTPDVQPAESAASLNNGDRALKKPKNQHANYKTTNFPARRAFFIDLMRTVPHPVAIVTARKQDVEDDVQGTVAATVSSFNTVSLDPDLVVSFNLKSDSITYQTMIDSKYFAITFPQMNTAGANLTHSFTRGNDPSPFSTNFPDHPTPQPHRWLDGPVSNLNYNPPLVALAEPDDFENSGFAFAIICEYQTSTPIGDHVIVTGRVSSDAFMRTVATGWGSKVGKHLIEPHEITLAHVHGTYSNSDTKLGFMNLLKMDDQSLWKNTHSQSLSAKIHWCRNRLEGLAAAQMLRQGIGPAVVMGTRAKKHHLRFVADAKNMKTELLVQYERYYMLRLQNLEHQARQATKDGAESTSEEPISETDAEEQQEVEDVPYAELLGHQQLFVRNKMLLSMEELEEEIALYTVRLTALRLQAEKSAAQQDPEDEAGSDSVEELAPEESDENSALQPEEDGLSRNLQLRRYFLGRIHLLQHAKTRKVEFSKPAEKIAPPRDDKSFSSEMRRFIGVNRVDSLQGLKTKYRRFHYQITEAKLSLIGLEELPDGHPNVPILRDRIKYFTPRLEAIVKLIQERAKNTSIKELLVENFPPPPMKNQDDWGVKKGSNKKQKLPKVKEEEVEPVQRKLVREVPFKSPMDALYPVGESVDQLDFYENLDEQTKAAIQKAAEDLPVGTPVEERESREAKVRPQIEERQMTPQEQAEEDLRQMQQLERDLMQRSANRVRDYLTMKSDGDEDMPSAEDFIDVVKMREERLRKQEDDKNAKQGTTS